ncbi:MAG: hypothetical protein JXX14_23545 [Deltaproteobacteria bacterium]|nr:hypothetical protein [Deltaproteobacteria bacterium]
MKWIQVMLLALFGLAAACSGQQMPEVRQLSLRDPRLSLEARRWLADAEDEVVIARAGVEMAASRVMRIEDYRDTLTKEEVFLSGPSKKANVDKLEQSLYGFVDAQLTLEEAQLLAAQKALELAYARLTQVRAETAIRFDLAVYPMEPIVHHVEQLKSEVASANSVLENLRVEVENRAGQLWRDYAAFVQQGGVTRNFWKYRSL